MNPTRYTSFRLAQQVRPNGYLGNLQRSLLFLYFLLNPFYLFPSGLPQIGDLFLFGLISTGLLLPPAFVGRRVRSIQILALGFAAVTLIVNVSWGIFLEASEMFLYPMYYIFNALALLSLVSAYMRSKADAHKWRATILWGVASSIFLQFGVAVVQAGTTGGRVTAFFNNPNQLGYFALLSASLFVYVALRYEVGRWQIVFVMLCSIFLATASLSKAAMLGLAPLLAAIVIKFPRIGGPIAVIGIVTVSLVVVNPNSLPRVLAGTISAAQARLATVGAQEDDSAFGRGYTRMLDNPEYIFTGAGEGAFWRFTPPIEMHSSWGTLAFSYGILGTILFGALLTKILTRASWLGLICFAPVIAYGFTHQGLRATLVWILLACFCMLPAQERRMRLSATSATVRERVPVQTRDYW